MKIVAVQGEWLIRLLIKYWSESVVSAQFYLFMNKTADLERQQNGDVASGKSVSTNEFSTRVHLKHHILTSSVQSVNRTFWLIAL